MSGWRLTCAGALAAVTLTLAWRGQPASKAGIESGNVDASLTPRVVRGHNANVDPASMLASTLLVADDPRNSSGSEALRRRELASAFNHLGMSRLADNDTLLAGSMIELATNLSPETSAFWTNHAAALLQSAASRKIEDPALLVRALNSAIVGAGREPADPTARFNAALAQRKFGLDSRAAWGAFATTETHPELQRVLPSLTEPGDRSLVKDAIEAFDDSRASDAERRQICLEHPGLLRGHAEDSLLGRWAEAVALRDDAARRIIARQIAVAAECASAVSADLHLADVVGELDADISAPETAALARAFTAYTLARSQFENARDTSAAERLAVAVTELRSAPTTRFGLLVDLLAATLDYQFRHLPEARATLASLTEQAVGAGYTSIAARALLIQGSVSMQLGRLSESYDYYSRAASLVSPTNEPDLAATAAYSMANTARLLGDTTLGWRPLLPVIRRLSSVESLRRRYMVLYNASLLAELDGLLPAAEFFEDRALDVAKRRQVAGAIAEALGRIAALQTKLGHASSPQSLAAARAQLSAVDDRTRFEYYEQSLNVIDAQSRTNSEPSAAISLLTGALKFFRQIEPRDVPTLHLYRGRAHRVSGRLDAARRDFEMGIVALERTREATEGRQAQVSLLDTAWQLYAEMLDLHSAQPGEALAYAERGRSRALLEASGLKLPSFAVANAAAHVPRGSAVAYYRVLPSKTLVWVLRRGRVVMRSIPTSESQLQLLVRRHSVALESGLSADELAASRDLHDVLVRPIDVEISDVRDLVICADGPLGQLSFAALLSRTTDRRLVEDYEVTMSPSIGAMLAERRSPARSQSPRILIVANPEFDPQRFPGLRRLPGAQREARAIAATYAESTTLLGRDATKAGFIEALSNVDIAHVGTHAVLNESYPSRSELVFSATGESSTVLSIGELMTGAHRAPEVAVLAACGTARGTGYRMEGVVSLASAFMAAGTRHVIATLRDVSDSLAEQFFVSLHRQLAAGVAPSRALAMTQREFLGATDQRLRDPRAWASYVAISRGFVRED